MARGTLACWLEFIFERGASRLPLILQAVATVLQQVELSNVLQRREHGARTRERRRQLVVQQLQHLHTNSNGSVHQLQTQEAC